MRVIFPATLLGTVALPYDSQGTQHHPSSTQQEHRANLRLKTSCDAALNTQRLRSSARQASMPFDSSRSPVNDYPSLRRCGLATAERHSPPDDAVNTIVFIPKNLRSIYWLVVE